MEHELTQQRELAAKRLMQLKTIQALSLGIFGHIVTEHIYQLACQTIVHQLLWDTAFVVSFQNEEAQVVASYQATQKQLDHLHAFLASSKPLQAAYHERVPVSTFESNNTTALSLTSLFQTDHVSAVPIIFGEELYGYLVACSHTHRGEHHGSEDREFLSVLASQVGYAVQQSISQEAPPEKVPEE